MTENKQPKEKKSIAFYFHRLGNPGGGAERILCQLLNYLDNDGFNVHLLTWDLPGASSFYPLNKSINWHQLGFKTGVIDKVRRAMVVKNILRTENIKILVGFVMSGDKTIYAAAKMANIYLVAAERNAPAMYYLRYNIFQRWTSFIMMFLFCSKIIVQFPEYIKSYPYFLRKRIVSISNPVYPADIFAHPEKPGQNDSFTLLAIGRLDRIQKRFDCLLQAFKQSMNNLHKWNLLLIGDGPERQSLEKLISELGLNQHVEIKATTRDIEAEYKNAHLFVIPSRWEGFPNVLAEAMSHGLPAIGFAGADGVNLLIRNGESGWLAEGLDNVISLAEQLSLAMGNAEERVRRGKNAILQMKKYDPVSQYKEWVSLLNNIVI